MSRTVQLVEESGRRVMIGVRDDDRQTAPSERQRDVSAEAAGPASDNGYVLAHTDTVSPPVGRPERDGIVREGNDCRWH